jgi:succinate-semialdehyde dehydrogenase/glutarate-semialdehyde dehydrogenase
MPYQSVNPATGQLSQMFEEHSNQQMMDALAGADRAYREFWSIAPHKERAGYIGKAARLMLEQKESLARLATIEMGKRIVESRGEVELRPNLSRLTVSLTALAAASRARWR